MIKREVLIQNRKGLHARASAKIVKVAESFQAETHICYQERRVPAESIMGLLMLGAGQGSLIIIEAEGNEAEKVVDSLVQLIEDKFGEDQW
ncbi:MAG: HPr family phosphocarrier protein [Alphaproteobacteria bacterium]|nr:HPr family phosphocarrier protein [Alphaproteobacteria bacterium]